MNTEYIPYLAALYSGFVTILLWRALKRACYWKSRWWLTEEELACKKVTLGEMSKEEFYRRF